MAFRLLCCELYKLKRTPFVGLVALAACLFPVPAALLALNGGTDGTFLSLSFLLLVMLAGPLLLPVVGGCLAVLLFHRERDWETLKNLYTVPVRWPGLVAAKLFVVYLGCILFAVISLMAAAATIAATGTPVTSLFTSLAAAGLLGFFYASATLPVILLVLWLDRGTLVSILLCVLYGVAQSTQLFGGVYLIAGTGPVETVSLASPLLWTFPMLVFRWYTSFAASGQLVLPPDTAPFYLSTPPLAGLCLVLIVVCGAAIVWLGRRQEV